MIPATGETFWIGTFIRAMVFESEGTQVDMVVLCGIVEKSEACYFYFYLFSIFGGYFTICKRVSATLALARTKNEGEENASIFHVAMTTNHAKICFPTVKTHVAETIFEPQKRLCTWHDV